jgi:hypothetical protein
VGLIQVSLRPFRADPFIGRFPGLKPRAEIGVGTKVRFAPPSEPDWQIPCIRLSSRWLTFKKDRQAAARACLKDNKPTAEK